MVIGIAFWVLMLVWLCFAGVELRKDKTIGGPTILTFVLFALLGWSEFHAALHV